MQAIVLAGGFGTRLQTVVKDVPKPMAEINGFPFLKYLLDTLVTQGFEKVVLSVGYKQEIIKNYFQARYQNMEIVYSSEDTPLGTGGAIVQSLEYIDSEQVFVLNGDTFFEVDFDAMMAIHCTMNADITLAAKEMHDFDRYGTVVVENSQIIGFQEKQYQAQGLINGGIYLLNRTLFQDFTLSGKFSFESDFLEKYLAEVKVAAFISEGYFIDIGIPEDYYQASTVFNGR